jgi:hypothetical protein
VSLALLARSLMPEPLVAQEEAGHDVLLLSLLHSSWEQLGKADRGEEKSQEIASALLVLVWSVGHSHVLLLVKEVAVDIHNERRKEKLRGTCPRRLDRMA